MSCAANTGRVTTGERMKRTARQLVSINQAAEELQVSPRTVRRYIAAGLLTRVPVGPRLIRIDAASLDRLTAPVGAR